METVTFNYETKDGRSVRAEFALAVRFDDGHDEYRDVFMDTLKTKMRPCFSFKTASDMRALDDDYWSWYSQVIKKNMNDNAKAEFEPFELESFELRSVSLG